MNGKEAFALVPELVLVGIEASTRCEVLATMSSNLFRQGYVQESYIQAIQEREIHYPTGLPAAEIGVAIPHTDAVHVNRAAVSIGILKKPVLFQMMGNPNQIVEAEIIFMLAIKEPQEQINMLQKLSSLFQNRTLLRNLRKTVKREQAVSLLNQALQIGA